MNTRVFIVGVVLLVAGFMLFWYGYQIVQELSSTIGLLARSYNSDIQQRYEMAKYAELGGGALAIIGLATTLFGVLKNPQGK